jgi:uncharacterized protein (TIGR03086 family)
MITTTEQMLSSLADAVAATGRLIVGVRLDQWGAPTPCEEMTVVNIIEHLVGGLDQFADVPASGALGAASERHLTKEDARDAFEAAGRHLLQQWSLPDVAERTYEMPWGATPGTALIGFMLIEEVTHGWDLARATGQVATYADDVVEATFDLARSYDDETIRVPGMFGAAVPVSSDAPLIDRLAAFLGRQPYSKPITEPA